MWSVLSRKVKYSIASGESGWKVPNVWIGRNVVRDFQQSDFQHFLTSKCSAETNFMGKSKNCVKKAFLFIYLYKPVRPTDQCTHVLLRWFLESVNVPRWAPNFQRQLKKKDFFRIMNFRAFFPDLSFDIYHATFEQFNLFWSSEIRGNS
jgi:hypothetical protein